MLETGLWALCPSPQNPHYIKGFTSKISHFHLNFLSLTLKSSQLSLSRNKSGENSGRLPAELRRPATFRRRSGNQRFSGEFSGGRFSAKSTLFRLYPTFRIAW
ncbi:hypothetical protein HanIR_Chr02g0053731 [Helianthus annuus]|nr:hypothetical protein HanIR_Chr02g0053731 [Helianthus annuus]